MVGPELEQALGSACPLGEGEPLHQACAGLDQACKGLEGREVRSQLVPDSLHEALEQDHGHLSEGEGRGRASEEGGADGRHRERSLWQALPCVLPLQRLLRRYLAVLWVLALGALLREGSVSLRRRSHPCHAGSPTDTLLQQP